MLLSEAMLQVRTLLGFRTDLTQATLTQLTRAQEELERGPTYPWFLLSEEATTLTSENARRVQLPPDFIAEYEYGALWYVPDDVEVDELELDKKDYDDLRKSYGTTAMGPPCAYAKDGFYFRIFPLPDAEYTLKMLYYKKDQPISSVSTDATNKWLTYAPNVLIGKAGKILAIAAGNQMALGAFTEMETQGRVLLRTQNEEQKHTNRSYQMGGPEA